MDIHYRPTPTYYQQPTAWESLGLFIGTPFSSPSGHMMTLPLLTSFELSRDHVFLWPAKCEGEWPASFPS